MGWFSDVLDVINPAGYLKHDGWQGVGEFLQGGPWGIPGKIIEKAKGLLGDGDNTKDPHSGDNTPPGGKDIHFSSEHPGLFDKFEGKTGATASTVDWPVVIGGGAAAVVVVFMVIIVLRH